MTRNILPAAGLLAAVLLCLLSASCKSTENKQKAPSGKFMQNEQSQAEPSKNYFEREREKRREHEREFRDVRRPINQDHFQVLPTHGKNYTPRSERLHESSRDPNNTIYGF